MNNEEQVGRAINTIYNTNIYENRRTKEIVEYRSLMCYILHKDLKLTLYKVRDHFNSKGKKLTHCSVIHNVKLFDEFRKSNNTFEETRDKILSEIDPKFMLIEKIKEIQETNKIEAISNCVNYYEPNNN